MSDLSRSLPRILCLHGSGVSANVFRLQCRSIIHGLKGHFRFVFADGPIPCPPHKAIADIYGDYGPFARWLSWKAPDDDEEMEEVDPPTAALRISQSCRKAMDEDQGTGPWVGVLGFSQGGKATASLLWAQENLTGSSRPMPAGIDFKFGVIMASGAPFVMLDITGEAGPPPRYVNNAAALSTRNPDHWPPSNEEGEHLISIPTLHVHGLQDPGLKEHRIMLNRYFKKGTTRLVEWNGDHRLPIKTSDVEMVTDQLLQMARNAGIVE